MPLEFSDPPLIRRRGPGHFYHAYGTFLDALVANPGRWASLPLAEITGASRYKKQVTILNAAKNRRIRIQTTVQQERLYARTMTEQLPEGRDPESDLAPGVDLV